MQVPQQTSPELVVEELQASNHRMRVAVIALGALSLAVCACFALFLVYAQFTRNVQVAQADATARPRQFANTWTPTPTDTPEPTGTPRPTSTSTATPTASPIPTETPPEPTATTTPRAPTNTPRPFPTNTPRPKATNTKVPPAPPTNTPAPAFTFNISGQRSTKNCGSIGVFGVVRDRSGNLASNVVIRLIQGGGAFQRTTVSNFIGSRNDRNYEISNIHGLTPGAYTFVALDGSGTQVSPAVNITITPLGDACDAPSSQTQWWEIDLTQT